jgi:hypothetical protein
MPHPPALVLKVIAKTTRLIRPLSTQPLGDLHEDLVGSAMSHPAECLIDPPAYTRYGLSILSLRYVLI